jgi:hypothetical protein
MEQVVAVCCCGQELPYAGAHHDLGCEDDAGPDGDGGDPQRDLGLPGRITRPRHVLGQSGCWRRLPDLVVVDGGGQAVARCRAVSWESHPRPS